MRLYKTLVLFTCITLAACGEKDDSAGEGTTETTTTDAGDDAGGGDAGGGEGDDAGGDAGDAGGDAGGDEGGDEGGAEGDDDGGAVNYAAVADYAAAYCDAILVRCGVYSTTEECVDFAMANWFGADCVVASQESALECITWLEGLECTDEGWIDACDQAISCG